MLVTETRVWALVALSLALVLFLGLAGPGAPRAGAADPDLEFEMEVTGGGPFGGGGCGTVGTTPTQKGDAICAVPGGGTITVSIQLANTGGLTGEIGEWQAVVGWTPGLEGPGDAASVKAFGFRTGHECPGLVAAAAPFVLAPRTAALGCAALPPPFSDTQVTNLIADFELTCGPDRSEELVTMIREVIAGVPDTGTFVVDSALQPFVDKDGSEVITIVCTGPVGGVAELPDVAAGPLEIEPSGVGAGFVGVAAVIAVGVLGLGGAVWYTRWRGS